MVTDSDIQDVILIDIQDVILIDIQEVRIDRDPRSGEPIRYLPIWTSLDHTEHINNL